MANHYMSLRGEFYLAKLTNGVAGEQRKIGNVPEFELQIDADQIEHKESMSGNDATDEVISNGTTMTFSGTLEEIDKANLAYVLSGTTTEVAGATVTDASLGTVTVNNEIKLNGYKLTAVSFKDSTGVPVTVDPSKYVLDAKYGTVKFTDLTGLTMPILATYTKGAVSVTTFADNFNTEYALFFKGKNRASGDDIAVNLWRTKKSASTNFGLIHQDDIGQYQIEGSALADLTKGLDPALGAYGHVVTIPK